MVKAPDCKSGHREFKSLRRLFVPLVQWLECFLHTKEVTGSIPVGNTMKKYPDYPDGFLIPAPADKSKSTVEQIVRNYVFDGRWKLWPILKDFARLWGHEFWEIVKQAEELGLNDRMTFRKARQVILDRGWKRESHTI